jgi:hypothetical protein
VNFYISVNRNGWLSSTRVRSLRGHIVWSMCRTIHVSWYPWTIVALALVILLKFTALLDMHASQLFANLNFCLLHVYLNSGWLDCTHSLAFRYFCLIEYDLGCPHVSHSLPILIFFVCFFYLTSSAFSFAQLNTYTSILFLAWLYTLMGCTGIKISGGMCHAWSPSPVLLTHVL